MSYEKHHELTILFADIAGSVGLYENIGDVAAHEQIVSCQGLMSQIVKAHDGQVIEIIGDEIMCLFNNADAALEAACRIQESIQEGVSAQINVRIGFHSGPTVLDDGHPFGDTVNVAARMVSLAKAGQIIISQQSYMRMSTRQQGQVRHFKRMLIKGKQEAVDVHEIVWDDDHTKQSSQIHLASYKRQPVSSVKLMYQDKALSLNDVTTQLHIGRERDCDVCIVSDTASRRHATVRIDNGRIFIDDHSTNGTYIKTRTGNRAGDNQAVFLRNESWLMVSSGFISLGQPVNEANENLIYFKCN